MLWSSFKYEDQSNQPRICTHSLLNNCKEKATLFGKNFALRDTERKWPNILLRRVIQASKVNFHLDWAFRVNTREKYEIIYLATFLPLMRSTRGKGGKICSPKNQHNIKTTIFNMFCLFSRPNCTSAVKILKRKEYTIGHSSQLQKLWKHPQEVVCICHWLDIRVWLQILINNREGEKN